MAEDEAEKKLKELQRRLKRLGRYTKVSGGIFSLSGIFAGLDSLLKIVDEMYRKGQTEERRVGEWRSKGAKAVYGFSIRLGGEGPVVERFGNIGEDERGRPVVGDEREPLVDLLDEPRQLRVIAELPGVNEEDIRVNVEEGKVTIKADTSTRKYHKDIPLPCRARLTTWFYKNGVLEAVLEKVAKGQA